MARERLEVFAMQKGWYRSSGRYLERRRWTTEDAQAALADLDASGLELAAFAREAGLEPQRLKRWRRALEGFATDAVFEEVVGEPSAMAMRIGVTTDGARGWFEVVLASGRVVRVPASFDAAALGRLLAVVEGGGQC
jgi:transposase-like protein